MFVLVMIWVVVTPLKIVLSFPAIRFREFTVSLVVVCHNIGGTPGSRSGSTHDSDERFYRSTAGFGWPSGGRRQPGLQPSQPMLHPRKVQSDIDACGFFCSSL